MRVLDCCGASPLAMTGLLPQMQLHADMALHEAEPGIESVGAGARAGGGELDQLAVARTAAIDRPFYHLRAEPAPAQVARNTDGLDLAAPSALEGTGPGRKESWKVPTISPSSKATIRCWLGSASIAWKAAV